jgi:predicted RNA binding protein YcfA (HicA-like mRNA interferase family)
MPSSISRRELIQKFKALGFEGPFSGSKHQFMKKGSLKVRIPNPHKGDISVGLVKQILKQADISDEAWDDA